MSRLTSQLAIVCGLVGISLMSLALFGGSWLYCQEKAVMDNNVMVDVAFRIGLWKVCPINPSNNASDNCKCIQIYFYTYIYNIIYEIFAMRLYQ